MPLLNSAHVGGLDTGFLGRISPTQFEPRASGADRLPKSDRISTCPTNCDIMAEDTGAIGTHELQTLEEDSAYTPGVLSNNPTIPNPPAASEEQQTFKQRLAFIVAMPFPGTAGATNFNGNGITEFLEVYEDIYNDYQVPESEKSRRTHYFESLTGGYISTLAEFVENDYQGLNKI